MSSKQGIKFYKRADFKLTLWYVFTFAVATLIIFSFMYVRLRHHLIKEIDGFLEDESRVFVGEITENRMNINEAMRDWVMSVRREASEAGPKPYNLSSTKKYRLAAGFNDLLKKDQLIGSWVRAALWKTGRIRVPVVKENFLFRLLSLAFTLNRLKQYSPTSLLNKPQSQ